MRNWMKKATAIILAMTMLYSGLFPVFAKNDNAEDVGDFVTNTRGIKVSESLLCDDHDCLENHVGKTLEVSTLPVSENTVDMTRLSERALEDVYVGMNVSGDNATVSFQGIPGTSGTFAVNVNDGSLAGVSGTGYCINHGAANPGENGPTICTWTAECTEINDNIATWNFVMTPPGVCDWGSVLGYQRVGMVLNLPIEPARGDIEIQKSSAIPELTDGNACYSLEGAIYGLYHNGKEINRLYTNKDGYAKAEDIPKAENYVLKEIKAPKGYALDQKEYPVSINSNQLTRVEVQDYPQSDPVTILLGKVDAETTQNMPQGSASLQDAEFTVKYYDVHSSTDPAETGNEPVRTWVVKTDERGFTRLGDKYKVSGDEFYKLNGVVTLPLGTLTIQETKAPEGYLINPEIFVRQVTPEGTAEQVQTYNAPTIKEEIVRGNVEIVKLTENADETEETVKGLEGVEFTFTSDTTKEVVKKIVTDENGFATTADKDNPRGGLICDTYTVSETKTPHGYKTIEDFKVTIKEDGVTLKGIYKEDKLIVSPVTVVKVDASTGKTIPVKNTGFRLLDSNKKPVKMTTHYPNEVIHETFKTDKNGQFTFPDKLKHGTYYLEEVQAPKGYLKGELLKFEVEKYSNWDAPLLVKYADENAMGKLSLIKVDQTTQKPLPAGAEFEISAAEDITTPDGTIRAKKGDVVDTLVTGDDSKAESKELYLGKYVVKEINSVDGYLLKEKEVNFTLKYKDQDTPIVVKEMTFGNKPAMGRINIEKLDATTDKPIPAGAEFEIRASEDIVTPDGTVRAKAGDIVDTVVIKEKGTASSKKLFLGNYEVQEKKAPEGYTVNDTVYPVELKYVDQNTPVVTENITVKNTPVKGTISIQKIDKDTKDVLSNAVFEILAKNEIVTPDGTIRAKEGEVVDTITTDENGSAVSKELFLGTYTVKETKQPQGYILTKKGQDVELKYANQHTALVVGNLTVENKPTELEIIKTDENEKPLPGVTFKIWNKAMGQAKNATDQPTEDDVLDQMGVFAGEDVVDPDMSVVSEYTTDTEGRINLKYLSPGTYCIQEIKADGYAVDKTVYELVIDENGLVDGNDKGVFKLNNKPNEVVITKTDKETKKPMEGVSFKIWNKSVTEGEDGAIGVVAEMDTDKDGKIKLTKLVPGTYCIQESKTLTGYVLDEKITEFTVSEDGLIEGKESYPVDLTNDFTKVLISKTDITGDKELPGAKLQVIEKESGKVIEEWTSTDKAHLIERMKTGKYILHEASAPKGYKVASDIEFEVKETEEIQKVTMIDELLPGAAKTGDNLHLIPWILIMLFTTGAVITVVGVRIRDKRNRRKR